MCGRECVCFVGVFHTPFRNRNSPVLFKMGTKMKFPPRIKVFLNLLIFMFFVCEYFGESIAPWTLEFSHKNQKEGGKRNWDQKLSRILHTIHPNIFFEQGSCPIIEGLLLLIALWSVKIKPLSSSFFWPKKASIHCRKPFFFEQGALKKSEATPPQVFPVKKYNPKWDRLLTLSLSLFLPLL